MINIKIKNSIKFPSELIVQDDLERVAEDIFIPILKNNIDQEVDLQEKRYRPNTLKYTERKRKTGLSTKVLTATGRLRNSLFSLKQGKSKIIISLRGDRKEIGGYLQNDMGLNFFGISTRMERAAIDYMKEKIEKVVNAGR